MVLKVIVCLFTGAAFLIGNGHFWYKKGFKKAWNQGYDEIAAWFDENMCGSSLEEVSDYVAELMSEGKSENYPVLVIDPSFIKWNGKVNPIEEE